MLTALASLPLPALAGDGAEKAAAEKAEAAFRARVADAVARGVGWVRKQQTRDGSFQGFWGTMTPDDPDASKSFAGHRLGETALALLVLRCLGAPADDPQVIAGFAWARGDYALRRKNDELQTYHASLLLLALEAQRNRKPPVPEGNSRGRAAKAGPAPIDDLPWIRELTAWLLSAQGKDGGFSYTAPGYHQHDHSNTQVALLALRAARACGAEVTTSAWRRAAEHLLSCQEPAGPPCIRRDATWRPGDETRSVAGRDRARGWGYQDGHPATGSMTAGGISSLVLCRSELVDTPGWDGKADAALEQAIWDGVAWIGTHFDVTANPGPKDAAPPIAGKQFYWLYGLERAGVLSGLPWMGTHDWYREGAAWLLEHQSPAGNWIQGALVEDCFALLFLGRATPPAPRGAVSGSGGEPPPPGPGGK